MKYQLVLQWPASALDDFDLLVSIEDQLIDKLRNCEVDGHDMGSGEANIFVHTDDPAATFAAAKALITASGAGVGLRAGFRKFEDGDYRVLWPEGLAEFKLT